MQTLITALGGFLRKHKASVVCERPETLRRYVAANELEFYAVSTFLRRTGTVRSIDDVEALIRGGDRVRSVRGLSLSVHAYSCVLR